MELEHRPRTALLLKARLDTTQQMAVGFLSLSGGELAARLADLAGGNPCLRHTAPPATATPPEAVDQGPGLMAHVMAWLPRLVPDPRDHPAAQALADTLDPSGYLSDPPAEIARHTGLPEADLHRVLAQLQQIEPAGLFAPSLAECLRLQLAVEGPPSPGWLALLNNLPLVAEGRLDLLAALCGTDLAGLRGMLARLRQLDPRPGAAFAHDLAPPRLPDLEAQRHPGTSDWTVRLCAETQPRLSLLAAPPNADRQQAEARQVLTALDLRNRALLAIGGQIAAHQALAFDRGPAALRPLTRRALAQAVGLHETTVGRIVRVAAIRIGGRVLGLADFVARPPHPGAAHCSASVTAMIRTRLAEEGPVSDAALSRWLAGQGIAVTRRRIAKYRAAAHIPPGRRHG